MTSQYEKMHVNSGMRSYRDSSCLLWPEACMHEFATFHVLVECHCPVMSIFCNPSTEASSVGLLVRYTAVLILWVR